MQREILALVDDEQREKNPKPSREKYGWHTQNGFDDEPSGWMIEGGEEAYYEAMKEWESNKINGSDLNLPDEGNPVDYTETIKCPECEKIQVAKVEVGSPFNTYIHHCDCGNVIMESDWDKAEGYSFNIVVPETGWECMDCGKPINPDAEHFCSWNPNLHQGGK